MKKNNNIKYIIVLIILAIVGIIIFLIARYKKKDNFEYTTKTPSYNYLTTTPSYNKLTTKLPFKNKLKLGDSISTNNISVCIQTIPNFISYLSYLGKGYDLSKENFNDIKTIGKSILVLPKNESQITDELLAVNNNGSTILSYKISEDTKEFFESIGLNTTFDMSAKSATVSAKLEASLKTGKEITKDTYVKGYKMYQNSVYKNVVINTNIYQNLISNDFKNDIEFIISQTNIEQPSDADWEFYDLFLEKYGSHMINSIQFGTKFNYTLTISSNKEIQKTTLLAAMSFEGGIVAGQGKKAGAKLESEYSEAEKTELSNSNTSSSFEVYGGSPEAVSNLLTGDISEQNISTFISSGDNNPAKTNFGFVAIWDLLSTNHLLEENNGICSWKTKTKFYQNNLKAAGSSTCRYTQFGKNLEKYYESKLTSNEIPKEDRYIVNQFNNKCISLTNDDKLILKDCNAQTQQFKGNTSNNIMYGTKCIQTEKDASFGASILVDGKDCGDINKLAKGWKWNDDKTIRWNNDSSLCLDAIVDSSSTLNGMLIVNNCNGSVTQQWGFNKSGIPVTLPPIPTQSTPFQTPEIVPGYYKMWNLQSYIINPAKGFKEYTIIPCSIFKNNQGVTEVHLNYLPTQNYKWSSTTLTFDSNFIAGKSNNCTLTFSKNADDIISGNLGTDNDGSIITFNNTPTYELAKIISAPITGYKTWILYSHSRYYVLELSYNNVWLMNDVPLSQYGFEFTDLILKFSKLDNLIITESSYLKFGLNENILSGNFANTNISDVINMKYNPDSSDSLPSIVDGQTKVWTLINDTTAIYKLYLSFKFNSLFWEFEVPGVAKSNFSPDTSGNVLRINAQFPAGVRISGIIVFGGDIIHYGIINRNVIGINNYQDINAQII